MVSPACYSSTLSEGRRFDRTFPPYMSYPERRFTLSSQDSRTITMAESQVEADSQPQRKRISVACGRCRKRKIRCSGDAGGGQPCSNCKSAGNEPCQFLRVSSSEAPMRNESGDFGYSVHDARVYAHRGLNGEIFYGRELPTLGSNDVLASYRSGSSYAYGGKHPFHAAVPGYGATAGYGEDFVDYSMTCSSQPTLNHDPANMVPYSWTSRSKQPGLSSLYVDPDTAYTYSNGTPTMLQRPGHAAVTESPNFSFSSMAAHLPSTLAATSPDRLLPTPVSQPARYAGLSTVKHPNCSASAAHASLVHPSAGELAIHSYSSSYDDSDSVYTANPAGAATCHSNRLATRVNPESYTVTGGEVVSMFSENDHSIRPQGSGVNLASYTIADAGRRGSDGASTSTAASSGSGGTTNSPIITSHGYVPGETTTEDISGMVSSGHSKQQQHHHPHVVSARAGDTVSTAAYDMTESTSSPVGSTRAHTSGAVDSRAGAVASRR